MKQTINKEWELEARRKLSNYWAGDWKILDDFISTLLKQQKRELKKRVLKHDKGNGGDSLKKYGRIISCADCGANLTSTIENLMSEDKQELREKIEKRRKIRDGMVVYDKTYKRSSRLCWTNEILEGYNQAISDILKLL